MPTVILYDGLKVRCRPMLNAMGAQESLEFYSNTERDEYMKLAGIAAVERYAKETFLRACRRNRAEKALRPDERLAFQAWRASDKAKREAVRAMLIDPPRKGVST